jgi:hypothetical protein
MRSSNSNVSKVSSSKFWYILYGVIVLWILFLVYFHYLSLEPQKPSETTTGGNAPVTEIINKLKPSAPTIAERDDDENIHIVFSTDCSFFQDWQTLAVFHSAINVKQKGKVTRIASGCSEEKQKELLELYKTLYPQYGAHFTPDFKTQGGSKKKYDFYNKPYGLHHWLLNANPPIEDGVVVILIDPDMIILRPFTLNFANDSLNIFMKGYDWSKETKPVKIGKGHPTGELYGLGAPWATKNPTKNFDRLAVCGEGSPCLKTTTRFGELHYRYLNVFYFVIIIFP